MKRLPLMADATCAFAILTWNSAAYVDRCLDSVLALPFRRVTAYVFDNGSADGTPEHVSERYGAAIDEGRLVLRQARANLGTTASRNELLGAISPSTDYICILDSDTEVYPQAFEALCAHYARDLSGSIGVMGPRMRNEAGRLQHSGRNLPTVPIKIGKAAPSAALRRAASMAEVCDTPVRDSLQDVGYLLSACWLFPYSTYRAVGPLDERIFYAPEDADWCARVHEAGLRVVYAHDAEILHAYQRLSHKKLLSKTNARHIAGLAYYFAKHRYAFRSERIWNPSHADLRVGEVIP